MATHTFDYNNEYLIKDGKPWFPIMGEMHYSRYDKRYWGESLYKMKAGGVDVVSSYVIWIHHEETEGAYDFTGNRDLRAFVETCKACDIDMFLRIGPWVHAEVRNGGFPDWLLKKPFECRTNDEAYLEIVKGFYTKIFEQVKGLLHKDGGPIIGVQIENEYGHCGGLQGEAGEAHIRRLTQMAKEIGFEVPFYTATGWGGAMTGGLIPVMGGYCDAPWDQRITPIEPSGNYIFTHERNDHNIGSDFGFGAGITFDLSKFPYLTAELGGGLQVTHHRRPIASSHDIGAMSLAKMGSGVNLLGYYMYHGGTNPKGKLSFLQESKATGSVNDLPELNYDFRAPIREFGQISETFKELKLYGMFVKDFGEEFCSLQASIPDCNPLKPTNTEDLRMAYRRNKESGYIFVNNYQKGQQMADHDKVVLTAYTNEDGIIEFPETDIKNGEYFFYPFNMKVGKVCLRSALATPLCILHNEEPCYVFYTDKAPCYDIIGDEEDFNVLTLTREEAKNAWKLQLDKEYLIISESLVMQTDKGIEIIGRQLPELKVFPDFNKAPKGFKKVGTEGEFSLYAYEGEKLTPNVSYRLIEAESTKEKKVYEVAVETKAASDYFLRLNYVGDRAKAFIEGEYITDHFYTGRTWEIGLKQFNFPSSLKVEVYPLMPDAPIYLEKWPPLRETGGCEMQNIAIDTEYNCLLSF